jgi:hypothetical protein
MANYILSSNNRYYVVLESTYGVAPTVTAANRAPGVRLAVTTQTTATARRDKTGTRSYLGVAGTPLRASAFEFETSLMASDDNSVAPVIGQLVQAALGGAPQTAQAQMATLGSVAAALSFAAPHGLSAGNAVVVGSELRFVDSVPTTTSVTLNAPLSAAAGSVAVLPAVSYAPAETLPSVTLYDYWDPATTVQRVLTGAGVDQMEIQVNGTEHRLIFSGPVAQHIDSSSFQPAMGGLAQFPTEPAVQAETWAPVPGNLGQAFLGIAPSSILTLTRATVRVNNNLATRNFEFGSTQPLALAPGPRVVDAQFELYSTDDSVFAQLYQAAQTQTPIPLTIQLGDTPGAMAAVYLKSFLPQVPDYDDRGTQLLWSFRSSQAQGTGDDEIYVALG